MAEQDSGNVEMDYEDGYCESSSDESTAETTNCIEEEELDSKQLSFKPILNFSLVCYLDNTDQETYMSCVRSLLTKNSNVYF